MADIFISYAREDREIAAYLAELFEQQGWSVWWDPEIRAGERFDQVIETALSETKCVVVLWSKRSVDSRWLLAEAEHARERGILIPVLLDDVPIPFGFRIIHAADLREWRRTKSLDEAQSLLRGIEATLHGAVEIVQTRRASTSVDTYLDSLQAGQKALNEVKVLFVGDGGSGKTSLLNRLTGRAFRSSEPQTHGISIRPETIMYQRDEIKLNLWDFGGQDIMHSTHQFFLSKRSLYVLVLDGRKEEDPEYWLQLILTFGGNSPILVVLNKIDQHPSFEVNRKFLQDKYPSIREFHRLSCRTSDGIEEFYTTLRHEVGSIEHLKTPLPVSWLKVKTELEELTEDYISYERYEEICSNHGIDKEETVDTLAELLNDLGVVLYFDAAILRETNVINPTWITGAVYKILNSKELADGKGALGRHALKDILDLSTYPKRRHDYIVELMKKFELCFSLDEETLLMPDLLDVEEPEFPIDEKNVLKFVFEYDFLPKSVMPRVIVNLHTDILGSLCWRTGVVLSDESFGARAIVRADERDKKISVFVTGDEKREYFSIIRKSFLDIHQRFQGLKVREKVPCICSECRRSGTPHFFDYRYLLQRRKKGKKTVDCQLSIEDVSLDALFDGLESPESAPLDGWDVFISYAAKDVPIVTDIVRDLKDHQVSCWWDDEQISPGDSISKKIELGLRKSRFIMPCISSNQVKSGWSRVEYASILHKVISGRTSQKVTPLIIDDLPEDEIPLLLQDFRAENLSDRRGYERLITFLSGT